ncbi:MAG: 16S rRNA (uracil(1498)-N(3))-methyltransferase [Spongiibacteraceae bacterium]
MRISRIFTEALLQAEQLITLDEKASHYLSKVLRLKVDAPLILFNGDGHQYPSTIAAVDKKTVSVRTERCEIVDVESPLSTHLGIALSKGDRMDLVMQKATELGVTAITPLLSERSEVKLKGERADKKQQHWQQILISSCEQCGRNKIPQLNPIQTIDSWTESVQADKKLVLHHRSDHRIDPTETVSSVAILIGPEGGLSEREIQAAQQKQFAPLTLGPRVLRTETAPLVALAILQQAWGDF